jgi:hypothetical protein
MDNNKKFILYKRVSTRRGQDSRMRIRDLKIYCERRRWKVVGEYVDLKVARQGSVGLYRRKWQRKDGKIITSKPWWVSLVIGGRQHCESTHTSNKRLAQKILDIRRAEIAEGRFPALLKSHAPTLKDYISQYLKSRTDLHPNTVTRYEVSRRCLENFFPAARLPDITDARIEEYKKTRLQGTTGPAGVNRDLSLLRQVLKRAKRERYIVQSPLDNPDHFLNERKERLQAKPFTLEEEQRLLSVAKG